MMRGNAEQGFERDVPIKTAVVPEDEFFEIGVDVFSAQAVIRTQAPAFQQGEDPMNPWQRHMARHLADDVRVMTVAPQRQIGRMAVGEERRAGLHVGFDEGLD